MAESNEKAAKLKALLGLRNDVLAGPTTDATANAAANAAANSIAAATATSTTATIRLAEPRESPNQATHRDWVYDELW